MTKQNSYEVMILAQGVKECRMVLNAPDTHRLHERIIAELPSGCIVIGTPKLLVKGARIWSPA